MYRLAYYNDPPGGSLAISIGTSTTPWRASGGQIGVRWYEFHAPSIAVPPLGVTLAQSGTYAPDLNYRWMGSVAADRNSNILVGYSLSSSTLYPSVAVAGCTWSSCPSGNLEPESLVVGGTGSQPGTGGRRGDYSSMRIDPDGCTFWYTQEYYQATQSFDWSTQIASVKFAGCKNLNDGYIEICKESDPDHQVMGNFNYTISAPFFNGGPYQVAVGSCSPPLEVPSGTLTVTEAPQLGVAVENVTAYSYSGLGYLVDELDSWTPPNLSATINVVPGGVNLETIATFTNYAAPPGALKVCKIAGSGVKLGTPFYFTATGLPGFQINAGPGPGGSCEIVGTLPALTSR